MHILVSHIIIEYLLWFTHRSLCWETFLAVATFIRNVVRIINMWRAFQFKLLWVYYIGLIFEYVSIDIFKACILILFYFCLHDLSKSILRSLKIYIVHVENSPKWNLHACVSQEHKLPNVCNSPTPISPQTGNKFSRHGSRQSSTDDVPLAAMAKTASTEAYTRQFEYKNVILYVHRS